MRKGFFILFIVCMALMSTTYGSEVTGVNFIQEGEVSKLIIDFDQSTFAERKHIKEDKQIILDVKNAKADAKYFRGIDTSEFSGSVVYVSAYKKPGTENDIRFTLQLRDNVRSFLEQKPNRIVLNVENRFGVFTKKKLENADESAATAATDSKEKIWVPKSDAVEDILDNLTQSGVKKYIGKKISINVNSVPYHEVMKMISETSGFNIIIDDEIKKLPPLTIKLTNIPWDQALDTILSLGNLVAQKHANILTIRTEEKALEERNKEIEQASKDIRREPLVTKIFPLSFAKHEDLSKILEDYLTPKEGNFKGGSIKTDARTNNLIIQDTVSNIERIKKIIEILDTQTPQILIQSKIVEASENYEFRAGLGAGIQMTYDPFSDIGTNAGSFELNSAPNSGTPTLLNASIQVFKRITNLDFQLDLMESESKGRVVSSPKVITQNNQEAKLTTTKITSYRKVTTDATGGRTFSFEQISANIDLTVTPKVTNEGSIDMKVSIKKDSFGAPPTDDSPPDTTTRAIETNVLVDNGSTVVIGGLYQSESTEVNSGVPFLKDLPLIGWLFRSAYNPKKSRSELIVFLTPRIINQEEAGLVQKEALGDGV